MSVVLANVLGFLLLGEVLSLAGYAGIALAMCGILVLTSSR
jgi:uncharacterized membrane protein